MAAETLVRGSNKAKAKKNTKSGKGLFRSETDSLFEVEVAADRLWRCAATAFVGDLTIGKDLIPREIITAHATLKKGAAIATVMGSALMKNGLIMQTCNEIFEGENQDMFPLHVWMSGSGTRFKINVNEVISNRQMRRLGAFSRHP